jgi:2-keto-4-pentenoate hydratase
MHDRTPHRTTSRAACAHSPSEARGPFPAYERAEVAFRLLEAERLCRPTAGVTPRYPSMTLDEAYEVQWANVCARQDTDARIVGHKVGLTSEAMREQMGVSEPDSGVLLDDMQIPHGGVLHTADLLVPRLEAEFGFRLRCDLVGNDVGVERARSAVGEILLALEVIDSRFGAWDLTVIDSIADNASSARFVVGDPVAAPDAWDVRASPVTVRVDGTEQAHGLGAAVMGDPVHALVWLARRLHRCGRGLRAGDLVLAGAVHASLALQPGRHIEASSPPWPPVEVRTA